MKRVIVSFCAALFALPAVADELGRREYMNNCAACHGETGLGGGPIAEFLTVPVPNLTTLAADNGGVFPFDRVFTVIDGRAPLGAHGGPMPIWGELYRAHALDVTTPMAAESVARGRILSLVYFLQSIQVQ